MSAEPSTTPIEYAPPDVGRRRLVRRASIASALLLLLISSYWWIPAVWHRVEIAYWYHRCLAYRPEPGKIVQRLQGGAVDWPRSAAVGYVPAEWGKLYSILSPPGFQSGGTAFLGERRMPDGTRVLLAVDLAPASVWSSARQREALAVHVRTFVTDSGGSSSPRQVVDTVVAVPIHDARLRVLAGTSDPDDPTHFTIPYVIEKTGQRMTIEGWMRPDGVDFKNTSPTPITPSRQLPASPG
jgi:hypothetical protein